MVRSSKFMPIVAGAMLLSLIAFGSFAAQQDAERQAFSTDQELIDAGYFQEAVTKAAAGCIPDGSVDDTLGRWSCCSGYAVSGSTVCTIPSDYGTTWASCRHVCGTALVDGCVPTGGVDDVLSLTRCCSGHTVPGSIWCLDPRDYGTDWKSCIQYCQ